MLRKHFDKAKCAVAVKMESYKYRNSVYENLKEYGEIANIVEIIKKHDVRERYLYAEFSSVDSVNALLSFTRSMTPQKNLMGIPSRILKFVPSKVCGTTSSVLFCNTHTTDIRNFKYEKTSSLEEQLIQFHENSRLREFDFDLRAFLCQEIQDVVGNAVDWEFAPFGSSVSGLGSIGSDLDIELRSKETHVDGEVRGNLATKNNRRQLLSRIATVIGTVGFSNLTEILHARVPIIRFNCDLGEINCDLSIANCRRKMNLSLLMQFYSVVVPDFPILVCCLRAWAKKARVVTPSPSFTLTNFGLTQLILFYLMKTRKVPTISEILSPNDDLLYPKMFVDLKLDETFIEFFRYYGDFEFKNMKLDLKTGKYFRQEHQYAMFVLNPLETMETNVTRNISKHKTTIFKKICHSAYINLQNHPPCLNRLFNKFF